MLIPKTQASEVPLVNKLRFCSPGSIGICPIVSRSDGSYSLSLCRHSDAWGGSACYWKACSSPFLRERCFLSAHLSGSAVWNLQPSRLLNIQILSLWADGGFQKAAPNPPQAATSPAGLSPAVGFLGISAASSSRVPLSHFSVRNSTSLLRI